MMSAFIKMDNIEKYYESSGNVTKAIDRISFEIKEGEFIGIMGESGSGKTSLLNILGTVDTATAGHIYFDGKDITKMSEDERAEFRKQNLGFVFQNFNLLDMLTIQGKYGQQISILYQPEINNWSGNVQMKIIDCM